MSGGFLKPAWLPQFLPQVHLLAKLLAEGRLKKIYKRYPKRAQQKSSGKKDRSDTKTSAYLSYSCVVQHRLTRLDSLSCPFLGSGRSRAVVSRQK